MNTKPTLLLTSCLLACAALILSCKKDKSKSKTRSELIIGTWQLTSDMYNPAYDFNGDGNMVTEAISFYDDCEKDNLIIFSMNSTGVVDEGSTKCDPDDDQTFPFAWQLVNNDTQINISLSGDPVTIVQLDDKTLKVSSTFTDNGVTYTNTETYSRK